MFFKKKKSELSELFENEYFVMLIPVYEILDGADEYKLIYRYPNVYQNAQCYKVAESCEFNCEYLNKCIKKDQLVIIEMKEIGSLIFGNYHTSEVFKILQKHYSKETSYVFLAMKDFGYFKKLKDGVILRKIASYGKVDGVCSYPETRGMPCEYEMENKIYKIDMKARMLKDMLKFDIHDVSDLFDYYVGWMNIKNENILNIRIYELEKMN
ncbi:hypothetical protein [Traorella massiliensis]|uniref:hypothetical protein n=1 Tax=Traorella massiliensis TaxID=1903263 RepID=UPI00248F14C0|nr:hypothetical protein [Traorella massiliensis]